LNRRISLGIGAGITAIIIALLVFAITLEPEQGDVIPIQDIIKNEKLGLVISTIR